jgi:hypothetical protein
MNRLILDSCHPNLKTSFSTQKFTQKNLPKKKLGVLRNKIFGNSGQLTNKNTDENALSVKLSPQIAALVTL